MKKFEIEATLEGYFVTEDPKCPSYWRGSGVYDIECPCKVQIDAEVWAKDVDRAMEMLDEFDYDKDPRNPYHFTVEEVNVDDYSEKDYPDEDDDEFIEVSYHDFWVPTDDREYERDDWED